MKRIPYLFLLALLLTYLTSSAQSPSTTQNYVMETLVKHQGHKTSGSLAGLPVDSANRNITYIDGLGRPLQTVLWQSSPDKKDVINYNLYDAMGREAMKYLPYADSVGNDASYRTNAAAKQHSFYGTGSWDNNVAKTSYPYSHTLFEASPLSRVMEQGAPGATWQPYSGSVSGSGHTLKTENSANGSGEVALWTVGSTGASTNGSYPANRLFKTITKDENWTSGKAGTTAEFKDFLGRIILKRLWNSSSDPLSTYFVYDVYGNLRYVIPPAVTASFTDGDAAFNSYVYAYRYDGRKRVIEKKMPGKGWEYMVYNKLDQVCFTQDSVQRSADQWSWTKYDMQGRTVMTGIETGLSSTRPALQTFLDGQTAQWETRTSATSEGYTYSTPPQGTMGSPVLEFQTIYYYDDYSFPGYGSTYYPSVSYSNKTKGLLTGNKTLVLGTSTYLMTVIHYDDEGRLVETISDNHLGGTDRITNTYNFTGELTATLRTHIVNGNTTTVATNYTYDHAGRKLSTKENINSQGDVWLNKMEYNGIGQLKQKNLHSTNGSTFMQNTKLSYNERGWMKAGISSEFSIKLGYDTLSNPQYNGNVSMQLWGSGSSFPNRFDYGYDKLNRLTSAATTSGLSMSEVISYDPMGNIATMNRNSAGTATYSYTGNQLGSISGGSLTTGSYAYDGNGNATIDGRTGAAVSYNQLNLPYSFIKSSPDPISLSYTYDASGRKLKTVNNVSSTTTDYVGGFQYTNGSIDFIQTEEGRALNNSGTYTYQYDLKDHLGNVRYSFDIYSGAVRKLQEDAYYAFGKRYVVTGGNNQYLYNGKELQGDLGQYDYGARFYDPEIGRWNTIDPHGEKYNAWSPYNYAFNDPANTIDPDGRDGMVTGSGTKDDPYVITAKYYYVNGNLSAAEIKGLNSAIAEYNKMGGKNGVEIKNADGTTSYVKYNLSSEGVKDKSTAVEAAYSNAFKDKNDKERYFGNIVEPGRSENPNAYGSATNREINYDRENIAEGIKGGMNESSLLTGISVHEIGHNLGGEHADGTDTMAEVHTTVTTQQIGGTTSYTSYPSTSKDFTRTIFQRRDTRNTDPNSRVIDAGIYTKK